MPPNRGQHKRSQTANQQRRIFRGRGGPTDGNVPPKKATRNKVKYEHNQSASSDDVQQPLHGNDVYYLEGHEVNVDQLSLNDNESDNNRQNNTNAGSDDEGEEELDNNPLHNEILHVQKRIQNITLSIQSSPLGISNPTTWRSNCLLPIKKIVKEWRSILSFHSDEINERVLMNGVQNHDNDNTTIDMELKQLLHEAATKVFILIQMAMQTGPLVGSNPGYFKRCGGEVASVALEFLTHVIDLAGVDEASVDDGENVGDDNVKEEKTDHYNDDCVDVGNSSNNNNVEFSDSDVDSDSDSDDSSSCNSIESKDGEQGNTATNISKPSQASSTQIKQTLIIQTLQRNLLFTEKQAQKVHQWHRNAQKAAEANKAPSKSASKLQGQKSKKQRMKDLKMERKLKKKKKKGRGRK